MMTKIMFYCLFQWQHNLDEILLLAQEDTDQWVAMIGDILKMYPSLGTLNKDVDDSGRCFHEIQTVLKKLGLQKSLNIFRSKHIYPICYYFGLFASANLAIINIPTLLIYE